MFKFLSLVITVFSLFEVNAQDVDTGKLKVYVDCRERCDFSYIKSEITIVDFVLDRLAADAHVLINAQRVGSGGYQHQLNFYGQNRFEGYIDTLYVITKPNATASEIRQKIVHYLMLGISPLIAKTSFASNVKIAMKEAANVSVPPYESDQHDKWNFWVYRVSASGQMSADRVYKNSVVSSNFSADRTTNKLKVEFNVNANLRNSVYTYERARDTTKYRVKNSDYGFFHNLVKSFSSHWSYGYQTNYSNNTFNNIKRKIFFNPAIEYNVYDYKEVNNRFFVIRYGVDVNYNNYYDTTIYNKISETLYGHRLSAAITFNKKWGTFNSGFFYRNYFNDWSLNTMGVIANADVRITGGLSFFVHVNGSVVHNQISLVKGGATEQEVLTRKRQLGSNYNYNSSFGISFRFGSILNNFVNPRFDGYGGF